MHFHLVSFGQHCVYEIYPPRLCFTLFILLLNSIPLSLFLSILLLVAFGWFPLETTTNSTDVTVLMHCFGAHGLALALGLTLGIELLCHVDAHVALIDTRGQLSNLLVSLELHSSR